MSEKKSQNADKGPLEANSDGNKMLAPERGQAQVASCDSSAHSAEKSLFVRPNYHSSKVDDEWQVAVAMPGVKRKDVSVSLEKGELTVFGRRSDVVPENWQPLYEERNKADFRLRLQLNFEADPAGISASLEDGVLKVLLPEHESARPLQIEVK